LRTALAAAADILAADALVALALAAVDILAAVLSADILRRFNGGRHFDDFGGRFDHGRFGRFGGFRRGFGFGGPFGYGGSYGYYGYGYDSCYVFTPSGYVWACY
jgi:hypothetical protein